MELKDIYNMQLNNQRLLVSNGLYDNVDINLSLPTDDVKLSSYHVQQLISEIGEVLEADKRWKNIRNNKYDRAHKLEEIADCFIVLMNIAIFSGVSDTELESMLVDKMKIVHERFKENIK